MCWTVLEVMSWRSGMGLPADRIGEFRRRINQYAAEQFPAMPAPALRLDCRLNPSQIDLEKLNLLAALEPCGAGIPPAVRALPHAAGQYYAGGSGQASAPLPGTTRG